MLLALLLAQVTPDTPDADVLAQLIKAFQGHEWMLAVPLVVFGVVRFLRSAWFAEKVPAFGAWAQTSLGGFVLGFAVSLLAAVINTVAAGIPLTVPLVVGLLLQTAYNWAGSIFANAGVKQATATVADPLKTLR